MTQLVFFLLLLTVQWKQQGLFPSGVLLRGGCSTGMVQLSLYQYPSADAWCESPGWVWLWEFHLFLPLQWRNVWQGVSAGNIPQSLPKNTCVLCLGPEGIKESTLENLFTTVGYFLVHIPLSQRMFLESFLWVVLTRATVSVTQNYGPQRMVLPFPGSHKNEIHWYKSQSGSRYKCRSLHW